jgi:hypothetical protein
LDKHAATPPVATATAVRKSRRRTASSLLSLLNGAAHGPAGRRRQLGRNNSPFLVPQIMTESYSQQKPLETDGMKALFRHLRPGQGLQYEDCLPGRRQPTRWTSSVKGIIFAPNRYSRATRQVAQELLSLARFGAGGLTLHPLDALLSDWADQIQPSSTAADTGRMVWIEMTRARRT